MYLDKNEFTLALKYSNDNPAFKDIINAKQAEICFAQSQFIECARIYADTQKSFEEICLKFLQVNENRALLVYLKKRLANLDPLEKTQITMLVVWIVDIYLNEMRKQEDSADLRREFEAFITLPFVVESMRQNRHIFYEIMTAHGDSQNLTVLTKLNRDYEYVINMHINDEQYAEALSVLRESNKMELYYKHCPVLMGYLPKETVRAIIGADKRLDPVRLIKNLVNPLTNRSDCVNELIRYLEYCVHSMNVEQGLVHNLLIEYYAKHGHGEKLVEFLETQGKEVSMLHYDVLHALRISEQYNIVPATVFLKCLLELWQEAVESALTYDIQIAKDTASMPGDSSIRKRLWLIIANHEIGHSKDPVKALQILEECDLLKIEDILPFLPDFEKIDDIKELICNSLKEYNARIEEQKREMDESDKSAQRVRNELQSFKGRVIRFSTDTVCDLCNFYLIKRDYQLYQCGHKYHRVCYEHELKALFGK
jgi:vacuolar protein sorting-associated protein 18